MWSPILNRTPCRHTEERGCTAAKKEKVREGGDGCSMLPQSKRQAAGSGKCNTSRAPLAPHKSAPTSTCRRAQELSGASKPGRGEDGSAARAAPNRKTQAGEAHEGGGQALAGKRSHRRTQTTKGTGRPPQGEAAQPTKAKTSLTNTAELKPGPPPGPGACDVQSGQ